MADGTRSAGVICAISRYMARLLEDSSSGRAQMTEELRGEIRLVARTIAALAEEERSGG